MSPYILAAAAALVLVHLLVKKDRNFAEELPRMSVVPRTIGYAQPAVPAGGAGRHRFLGLHLLSILGG